MKTINLINYRNSDVKYEIKAFPDGEPYFKLDPINRKETYQVICRITSPTELFRLMQIADILDRQEVIWDLRIMYLMTQRNDRVIDFNEPFDLNIISGILKSFKCENIDIFELHSDRLCHDISHKINMINFRWFEDCSRIVYSDSYTLCLPDKGAYLRYGGNGILLEKVRDLNDKGRLLKIDLAEVPDEINDKILVLDDLCDAGGTFILTAGLLREKFPNKQLDIFVSHMVNPKGIANLSVNYDNVYFTNSYKDWDNLPDNCHLIKIV